MFVTVMTVLWYGERHHLWVPDQNISKKQHDSMTATQLKQCQAHDFLILGDNNIIAYTRSGYDSTKELIAYSKHGQFMPIMKDLGYLSKKVKLIIKAGTPEAGRVAQLFLAGEKYQPQKDVKDPEGIWKYR